MPRRVRSRRNLTIFIRRPHPPSTLRPLPADPRPGSSHRKRGGPAAPPPPQARSGCASPLRRQVAVPAVPRNPDRWTSSAADAHGPRPCRSSPRLLGRRVGSPRRGGRGRAQPPRPRRSGRGAVRRPPALVVELGEVGGEGAVLERPGRRARASRRRSAPRSRFRGAFALMEASARARRRSPSGARARRAGRGCPSSPP